MRISQLRQMISKKSLLQNRLHLKYDDVSGLSEKKTHQIHFDRFSRLLRF